MLLVVFVRLRVSSSTVIADYCRVNVLRRVGAVDHICNVLQLVSKLISLFLVVAFRTMSV